MKKTFYARYAVTILLAAALLLPVLIFGSMRAMDDGNNDVRQWLPEGFAETRQYDWFLEHFGSEEMAVVSWPGATLDDPRMGQLTRALAPWTVGYSGVEPDRPRLFNRVISGPELVGELTSEPLGLSRAQALQRLQGNLVGPDQQTSGLVVMVSDEGAADRHRALEVIVQAAEREAGLSGSQLHLGGPTIDSVALDSESERSRYLLAGLSVLLALLLACACLRRVRLVLIVFSTAILCAGISVALVYFTGNRMSLVLVTMPTLIYVLAISASIHLVNYYRDALAEHGPQGAPGRAVASGWLPCTLTACTTAVGLGSLAVSEVMPVKLFGLYSALGVLASLPVLFLFLPAALQLWPLKAEATPERRRETQSSWAGGLLTALLFRRSGWITALGLAAMLLAGSGLFRLDTSVKLLNLFSPQARIIQDYTWLEENLGPLVPIEVVLHIDQDSPLTMLQRMELVGRVQAELDGLDKVGGTMSAATFAPQTPQGGGVRQVAQRRVLEKHLERNRDQFIEAHYLRDVEDGQLWRVSARVEALNSLDYGQFIELLREQVEPVLVQYAGTDGPAIEATYTGVIPLVYKAQRELLNDLTRSFLAAFLLIGVVMVVMLRSFRAGLLAMLPSIFPAVVIFGAMGWLDVLCDIGSMMTASVALGIAVDDTIHFLSWFRRGMQRGMSRPEAIGLAYRSCAKAMIQTTIICGLGLLVFSLSSFVPTARFATLMFTMLLTALVGDLILLPALLASPLGKCFQKAAAGGALWQVFSAGHRSQPARDQRQPAPSHPQVVPVGRQEPDEELAIPLGVEVGVGSGG